MGRNMRKTEEKFGMVLLRNLAGALAIVWMCVIFAFSAQTKEESGAVSESFTYHMVSSTRSFFHLDLSDARVKEIADTIEGLVRKAAHMAEYGFLAVLLYIWIGQWEMSFLRRGGTAVGATAVYAATDEFHQLFVAGCTWACFSSLFVSVEASGAMGRVCLSGARAVIIVAKGLEFPV